MRKSKSFSQSVFPGFTKSEAVKAHLTIMAKSFFKAPRKAEVKEDVKDRELTSPTRDASTRLTGVKAGRRKRKRIILSTFNAALVIKDVILSICSNIQGPTISLGVVGLQFGGVPMMAALADLSFELASLWGGSLTESPGGTQTIVNEIHQSPLLGTLRAAGSLEWPPSDVQALRAVEIHLKGCAFISTPLCMPRCVLGLVHEEYYRHMRGLLSVSYRHLSHLSRSRHERRWRRVKMRKTVAQELTELFPTGFLTAKSLRFLIESSEQRALDTARTLSIWSAWKFLPLICFPTILLSSRDDPLCPVTAIPFPDVVR
eukprot:Blabericola_migrator_1__4095@NODE_2248_length_3059_cov_226_862634_g1416_i0_p1_GENE_NODE_2248_length_3059_cov_226_862634_g1416_i0NODE_2248_length_3059_cov_226_862634_g1416_i0_p1_ORF_typecomplete_len316_score40_47_NODE_2248_length_3059_cov_226_862634_g1416_i09461893